MPLYDMRCPACAGIFEKLRPLAEREQRIACPYCAQSVQPETMVTARHVTLAVTERWAPRSPAEQLAGMGATGPGTRASAGRSSVLHVCNGGNCSLCN